MEIRSLHASFGRLSGAKLDLKSGINVITAPNETGKSTWCAFIKAMLYGVSSSERDKTGYLADKTRYRPWSGAPMQGRMDIVSGGREITLERSAHGASVMKNFRAVYSGTDEAVAWLTGDSAGRLLTGLEEPVFLRTAFIGQSSLAVHQDDTLEKRIMAMVSTGEDSGVSAQEAERRLRTRLRRLRYNKTGLMPQLEREMEELSLAIEKQQKLAENLADTKLQLDEAEKQVAALQEQLQLCHDYQAFEKLQRAKENVSRHRQTRDKLRTLLTVSGRELDLRMISDARSAVSAVSDAEEACLRLQMALQAAAADVQAKRRVAEASPFSAVTPDKAQEIVSQAEGLEKKVTAGCKKKLLAFTAGILAAAAAVLISKNIVLDIVGAAAAAVLAAMSVSAVLKARKNASLLESTLRTYNASGYAELQLRLQDHRAMIMSILQAEEKRSAAEKELAAAKAALTRAQDAAKTKLEIVLPEGTPQEKTDETLSDLEEMLRDLFAAEAALSAAQAQLEETLRDCPQRENVPQPEMTQEQAAGKLSEVSAEKQRLISRYGLDRGEMLATGDPAILKSQLIEKKTTFDAATREYDSLSTALEVMQLATAEIQTRLSPELNRRAGELLSRLTDGEYDSVQFDRSLEAQTAKHGDIVSHSALYMSRGAADQMYLALRLAMSLMLTDGRESCPIILDDALVNFDDKRMALALELLLELSKTRQIILFSCQSREAQYLAGRANTVSLA